MNPFLATDGYKTGHHKMYPQGTTLVYSNFTPRSNKYAPKGCDRLVSFGQQMVMKQIHEMFDKNFFKRDEVFDLQRHEGDSLNLSMKKVKEKVCKEIKKEYSLYLGTDYDVSHIEALWDLGYLPIKVKALPEGSLVPMGVPVLTIYNTKPEFYWLTNFLETLISNLLWKPMTSATIAYQYKKNLLSWAEKTDKDNIAFVEFQGHDFSMRGLDSIEATISSGLGHATSFLGSDSLPVIHGARKFYGEKDFVVGSVNATEHSVMCAGTKGDEVGTFRYLMEQFPTGILSIVSDTWDLWKVLTVYLPQLKEEILARDGKIVIRPDSGDPVDIICGTENLDFIYLSEKDLEDLNCVKYNEVSQNCGFKYTEDFFEEINESIFFLKDNVVYTIKTVHNHDIHPDYIQGEEKYTLSTPESKGVVELLWDIFGGTINKQGYKVLDPHIGAIYGDSITIDRAEEICARLEAKGFASTNIVLGVGSFTYQFNTRDTFGFAMKATYLEIEKNYDSMIRARKGGPGIYTSHVEGREIFKDPITDDGTKKSAKGLLCVAKGKYNRKDEDYKLVDQVSWEKENLGHLITIFKDGEFYNNTTLTQIRDVVKSNIK
jgi:nicotinic acid phosphoribosyltransferase